MTMILFSFNAHSACTPTPDCASIGYTETSCEGDSLKCPFDITKMMCMPCDSSFRYDCSGDNIVGGTGSACGGKYASCECVAGASFSSGDCVCSTSCIVGAIYYSDGSCSSCLDNSKTPVGVVVKDNELIMKRRTEGIQWSPSAVNIAGVMDYASEDSAVTDFNGKSNTQAIVEHFGENANISTHAGVFCYQYTQTGMENSHGQWYLPAAGELYSYVYGNYDKINATMLMLGWGYDNYAFWSSSEHSDAYYAWDIWSANGQKYQAYKTGYHSVTCFLEI